MSDDFPTTCDLCGKPTGTRSFYTHRALAHPETVKPIDPPPPGTKVKKKRKN